MAVEEGFIGNQSGMGQGLAYVLPESRTGQYAMQLAQEHTAQLRNQAVLRQRQQQQREQQYQQQLAQQKLPEYWAAAGKPINDAYNNWFQKAADYHAQTGRAPLNNPELMKQWNDDVVLKSRKSKELETNISKLLPLVAADDEGKYTDESKHAVSDYAEKALKDPISYLDKPAPQLIGTPSGTQDFLSKLKVVPVQDSDGTWNITRPDISKAKENAYLQAQDPRWNNLKASKYGINNDLPDFAVYNPDGKRVFHTNPKFTSDQADLILATPNDPKNAEVLAKLNITAEDPYKKEKLQDAISRQNEGWGTFISDAGRYAQTVEGTKKIRDYSAERMENAAMRLDLAQERAANKNGAKPVDPTYFQDLSERMRTGVPGSGEEFSKALSSNPAYLKGLKINDNYPKNIVIDVPAKYHQIKNPKADEEGAPQYVRAVQKPSYRVTLDRTDAQQWTAGLATLYKDITGDNTAAPSKAMTIGGKGKVSGGMERPKGKPSKKDDPLGLF